MQQRLPSLVPEPLSFAHRGARAHARENTMAAFELALRLGANGLETDAWMTRDGVVVLDHDGVVRGRLRRRPMSAVDTIDLPDHVPLLEALLGLDDGSFDVSIDVKDDAAADAIVAAVSRAGFDQSRVWLCFTDLAQVLSTRSRHPYVRVVNSARLRRMSEGVERRAAMLAEAGVDALNMHIEDWTGGSVALVHRFGLHAFGWDLQQEHVLQAGLRMGLDAIYSDHVDLMVEVYRREIGHAPRRR